MGIQVSNYSVYDMVPWAHPSPYPERHLNQSIRFGTAHAPDKQTHVSTDHATSVTIDRIVRRCGLIIARYRPEAARRYAPGRWQFDGGKNRGGSTSVRGRVSSPHISAGRRWLSCRQPACLQPRQLRHGTDRRTDRAVPKCPLGRRHNTASNGTHVEVGIFEARQNHVHRSQVTETLRNHTDTNYYNYHYYFSDWRTFPVLRSTCSWWVTTNVGKPSAAGQPTRPTQPFIPSGSINE